MAEGQTEQTVMLCRTMMGDCRWTGKPAQYVTSQLGQLSLLPAVGW